MVFTLHRYIFKELFKVFALTTIALTLMLSFGSLLKPIQDYGVGPAAVIKLLGYFLPITLTFVLPISALFSASLVYGRFAADNELDACRASGISLWSCIYPGLTLAVCVAITTLSLSFYVVPNYVHRAERAIKADAKQIFFRNLERNGYYSMPGGQGRENRIYADAVVADSDLLEGVIVAQVKDRLIQRLFTAKTATVRFDSKKNSNDVTILAQDVSTFDELRQGSSRELPFSARMGSLLTDNIKFKEIDELHQIRANIMVFYPVRRMAVETYMQLCAELLAAQIKQNAADTPITLAGPSRILKFRAQNCNIMKDRQLELTGDVVIDEYSPKTNAKTYTYRPDHAVIQVLADDDENAKIEMIAFEARWSRPDGTTGLAQQSVFQSLDLPRSVKKSLKPDVLSTVSDMPAILASPSDALTDLAKNLARKISKTYAGINAEINSRLVFGIGCIGLILIGSGLGIMLKGGHLLTAFGTSAIPAAILIICIMMGKNISNNRVAASGMSGIALMWAGLAILVVLTFLIYRKLLKN